MFGIVLVGNARHGIMVAYEWYAHEYGRNKKSENKKKPDPKDSAYRHRARACLCHGCVFFRRACRFRCTPRRERYFAFRGIRWGSDRRPVEVLAGVGHA